jgi:hypothetical protein
MLLRERSREASVQTLALEPRVLLEWGKETTLQKKRKKIKQKSSNKRTCTEESVINDWKLPSSTRISAASDLWQRLWAPKIRIASIGLVQIYRGINHSEHRCARVVPFL